MHVEQFGGESGLHNRWLSRVALATSIALAITIAFAPQKSELHVKQLGVLVNACWHCNYHCLL